MLMNCDSDRREQRGIATHTLDADRLYICGRLVATVTTT
jgi:hypothetical protein